MVATPEQGTVGVGWDVGEDEHPAEGTHRLRTAMSLADGLEPAPVA